MLRSFIRASIRNLKHQQQQRCGEGQQHLSIPAYVSSSSSRRGEKGGSSRGGKGSGFSGEGSIRQHRLASEVKATVSAALQQGSYDSALLQRCGFQIEEVKMSNDLRKAFVLWKAEPGTEGAVERELKAQGKRLRSLVLHNLSMPFSPSIQFRQDKVDPKLQAIDDVLSKLDDEDESD